ncbi:hypothetical protein [Haloferax larsenii]|uniref:Uncharacterized protein n=1 Tax=Haloferax larsenii TaxID=302484 RepID=A0A1H7N657_HALLR|nr:hypothetical protein [Haloferax larsenii]SEL18983.1 hypothetical protein SAMN04488691_103203 [Haloferax larsenii]
MNAETPLSEIELTADHFEYLYQAGASVALMTVVRKPLNELPSTVNRNSARDEIKKYVKWGEFKKDPSEFRPKGGHFFNALWKGDLYDAFTRADLDNRKILLSVFGEGAIDAHRPSNWSPTVSQLEGTA